MTISSTSRAPSSWEIAGTTWRLAQNVGATGILVRTGLGRRDERAPTAHVKPAVVVDTLIDAVVWVLQHP